MKFSIITPSQNQLSYLKRCIASVADQDGVEIEHWVIDSGSSDGTRDWLAQFIEQNSSTTYHLSVVSEPDAGIYDALNKGFDRASGDCFSWLNCDEQYLPGTLSFVRDWFMTHPSLDLLTGSTLLVRPDGVLSAFRKACPLRRSFIAAAHLYNLSCGMFFRSALWARGIHFDLSFRALGDQDWMMRLLRHGVRPGSSDRFLATFCMTGTNVSQSEDALCEEQRMRATGPAHIRYLSFPLNVLRWCEKALRGGYHQRPFDYAIYAHENSLERTTFHSEQAGFQWPKN